MAGRGFLRRFRQAEAAGLGSAAAPSLPATGLDAANDLHLVLGDDLQSGDACGGSLDHREASRARHTTVYRVGTRPPAER